MDVSDANTIKLVQECRYIVLDQRQPLDPLSTQYQDKFFRFWKSYWSEIHRSVGLDIELDDQEFLRQHKITALIHDDDVVAMHLLSCYRREQLSSEAYFQKFDPRFQERLDAFAVRRLLTLQFLAFAPRWKRVKEKPLIYLPMTIGSLSVLHAEIESAQAVISVARKDVGISNALAKMGFQSCIEDGVFNNTPVAYQISHSPNIHPHPEIKSLVEYYWKNRTELNNTTQSTKEVA